jgi:hypothetical protein
MPNIDDLIASQSAMEANSFSLAKRSVAGW